MDSVSFLSLLLLICSISAMAVPTTLLILTNRNTAKERSETMNRLSGLVLDLQTLLSSKDAIAYSELTRAQTETQIARAKTPEQYHQEQVARDAAAQQEAAELAALTQQEQEALDVLAADAIRAG